MDCLGGTPSTKNLFKSFPNSRYKYFTWPQGLQGFVGEIGGMGSPDDPEAAGTAGRVFRVPLPCNQMQSEIRRPLEIIKRSTIKP